MAWTCQSPIVILFVSQSQCDYVSDVGIVADKNVDKWLEYGVPNSVLQVSDLPLKYV